jgi:hypothetical protein
MAEGAPQAGKERVVMEGMLNWLECLGRRAASRSWKAAVKEVNKRLTGLKVRWRGSLSSDVLFLWYLIQARRNVREMGRMTGEWALC